MRCAARLARLQQFQKKPEARDHEAESHQRQARSNPRQKRSLRRQIIARAGFCSIRHFAACLAAVRSDFMLQTYNTMMIGTPASLPLHPAPDEIPRFAAGGYFVFA